MTQPRAPITVLVSKEYPGLADQIVEELRSRGLLGEGRYRDRNTLLRAVKEMCDEEDRLARVSVMEAKMKKCLDRRVSLGFPAVLAESESCFRAKLAPLVDRVRAFYGPPEFDAGKSQLEVVLAFPRIDYETQLRLVARAIRTVGSDDARLRAVGAESVRTLASADVDIMHDFDREYRSRVIPAERPSDVYALYGVHGGKFTRDYMIGEELAYFAKKRRHGLTLIEALGMLAEHPQFLVQEGRLILLGEIYSGTRYACLSYDGAKVSLRLILVPSDGAEAPQRSDPGFGVHRSRYGKPSAAGWIV